jgi:hypothetical protein
MEALRLQHLSLSRFREHQGVIHQLRHVQHFPVDPLLALQFLTQQALKIPMHNILLPVMSPIQCTMFIFQVGYVVLSFFVRLP